MVFYFTGTGNSLFVARSLDPEPISIPQVIHRESLTFRADRIGIVCPVYGHEMPQMVQDFIHRATFVTDYLYVVLTYGAAHGDVVRHVQRVFAATKHQPDLVRTILMVDNFLPGFDMEQQQAMDKNVEGQLQKIREQVQGREHFIEPVSDADFRLHAGYAAMVHHQDARCWANLTFTDRCIGCGLCTKVCPAGCIHLANGRAHRTGENCQACLACAHVCPETAIRLEPAFGFQEPNPEARYRNPEVTLSDLVAANWQCAGKEETPSVDAASETA